MSSLATLQANAPEWFEVTRSGPEGFEGLARTAGSPWAMDGLALLVTSAEDVVVAERLAGARLPRFCPERHIQGDGVFCLGFRRPRIRGGRMAAAWWCDLDLFLRCQALAEAMRLWPPQHSLDHGEDAASYHLRALSLARRLGLAEEYLRAYIGDPSWITGEGLARLGPFWAKPDPRGLGRRRPRIRRPSRNRLRLADLVVCEAKRRRKVDSFWSELRRNRVDCCGTMRDCPLAT